MLRLHDLQEFIRSLKIAWTRRIVCLSNSQWLKLFHEMNGNMQNIYFESMWFTDVIGKMRNSFCIDVLKSWQRQCKNVYIEHNDDLLTSCLRN